MENIQSSVLAPNSSPETDAASLWGVFGFEATSGLHKECLHTQPQTQLPPAPPPSSTPAIDSLLSKLSELCSLLTSAVQSLAALAKNLSTPSAPAASPNTPGTVTNPGSALLKTFDPAAFAESLKKTLTPDKKGQVHEEQLQYGILVYLLGLLGADKAAAFKTAFESASKQGGKKICDERAVKLALHELTAKGILSADQANLLNGISFAAAQLDSKKDRLYDNQGGKKDPTIAVAQLNQAISGAATALQGMQSGAIAVTPRPAK